MIRFNGCFHTHIQNRHTPPLPLPLSLSLSLSPSPSPSLCRRQRLMLFSRGRAWLGMTKTKAKTKGDLHTDARKHANTHTHTHQTVGIIACWLVTKEPGHQAAGLHNASVSLSLSPVVFLFPVSPCLSSSKKGIELCFYLCNLSCVERGDWGEGPLLDSDGPVSVMLLRNNKIRSHMRQGNMRQSHMRQGYMRQSHMRQGYMRQLHETEPHGGRVTQCRPTRGSYMVQYYTSHTSLLISC